MTPQDMASIPPPPAPNSNRYRNWQEHLDYKLRTQDGEVLEKPHINSTSRRMVERKRSGQNEDCFARAPVHQRLYQSAV